MLELSTVVTTTPGKLPKKGFYTRRLAQKKKEKNQASQIWMPYAKVSMKA